MIDQFSPSIWDLFNVVLSVAWERWRFVGHVCNLVFTFLWIFTGGSFFGWMLEVELDSDGTIEIEMEGTLEWPKSRAKDKIWTDQNRTRMV